MDTRVYREATPWGELHLALSPGDPPVARLILEGTFLMDSESVASEMAMAREGLRLWTQGQARPSGAVASRSGDRPFDRPSRVLIGGLGLGLTLRAVLDALGAPPAGREAATVVVAELFAALIRWNSGPLAALNGRALSDPRVACVTGDLGRCLRETPGPAASLGDRFDLMLLDTDNGPTWLSRPENAWMYDSEGVAAVTRWLRPGGVAVFWATEAAESFEATLASTSVRTRGAWGLRRIEAEPRRGQIVPPDVLYWLRCPTAASRCPSRAPGPASWLRRRR